MLKEQLSDVEMTSTDAIEQVKARARSVVESLKDEHAGVIEAMDSMHSEVMEAIKAGSPGGGPAGCGRVGRRDAARDGSPQ